MLPCAGPSVAGYCVLGKHCRTSPTKVRACHPKGTLFSTQVSSAAETEAVTSQKLVKGHAYSITGIEEVNRGGGGRAGEENKW